MLPIFLSVLIHLDSVILIRQVLAICGIISSAYALACFGRLLGFCSPALFIRSIPGIVVALSVIAVYSYGLNASFREWVNRVFL
jgi:hypothetical protein